MTETKTKFSKNPEYKCDHCGGELGPVKHGIPTKYGWKWFCSKQCLKEGNVVHNL